MNEDTVTVRYGLSAAAATEKKLRDKLISMGWTPPPKPREFEIIKKE